MKSIILIVLLGVSSASLAARIECKSTSTSSQKAQIIIETEAFDFTDEYSGYGIVMSQGLSNEKLNVVKPAQYLRGEGNGETPVFFLLANEEGDQLNIYFNDKTQVEKGARIIHSNESDGPNGLETPIELGNLDCHRVLPTRSIEK